MVYFFFSTVPCIVNIRHVSTRAIDAIDAIDRIWIRWHHFSPIFVEIPDSFQIPSTILPKSILNSVLRVLLTFHRFPKPVPTFLRNIYHHTDTRNTSPTFSATPPHVFIHSEPVHRPKILPILPDLHPRHPPGVRLSRPVPYRTTLNIMPQAQGSYRPSPCYSQLHP
jgi:hypothetical protein